MNYKNLNIIKNHIKYFKEIESTNSYFLKLLKEDKSNPLKLCIADKQTQGKGTRGKTWVSSNSGNIYMTYRITLPKHMPPPPIPIITAISIAEALENLFPNLEIQLKWPNDVFIYNKKIGGILIEIINDNALIGIGVNINPITNLDLIQQPITDITTELNKININQEIQKDLIIYEIIKNINKYLDEIISNNQNIKSIKKILTKWHKRDLYYKKIISVRVNDGETENAITAEHVGISACGGLLLEIDSKERNKKHNRIIKIYNGSIVRSV